MIYTALSLAVFGAAFLLIYAAFALNIKWDWLKALLVLCALWIMVSGMGLLIFFVNEEEANLTATVFSQLSGHVEGIYAGVLYTVLAINLLFVVYIFVLIINWYVQRRWANENNFK